jgi:hypothetical protein
VKVDLIAAHVLYRQVGTHECRTAPLTYHFHVDRWSQLLEIGITGKVPSRNEFLARP